MKQVLLSNSEFFNQAAILQEGKLIDYLFELNNNQKVVGNIYKGKVINILPLSIKERLLIFFPACKLPLLT